MKLVQLVKRMKGLLLEDFNKELLYCEKFKLSLRGSKWFNENCSVSAGGWAVGYPFLYALYRILNEGKPQKVLDLGLGQTSKVISWYMEGMCKSDQDAIHMIFEHDKSWIDFMKLNFHFSDKSLIQKTELVEKKYFNSIKSTYTYNNFEKIISKRNVKWDFISIDGPFGGRKYARMDVLNILPRYLADSFVIMIDDYDRRGEKNLARCIKKILTEHNIKFVEGVYAGEKHVYVITSEDKKWFTSL